MKKITDDLRNKGLQLLQESSHHYAQLSRSRQLERESLHYLYYFYGLFLHFSKINAVLNSESLPLVEINLIIKP